MSPAKGQYEEGSTLDISATPKEGWRFDHWEGDYSGSSPSATISVDADKNIKAVFEKKEYALTTKTKGQGSVDEKKLQSKSPDYPHGAVVELTANPSDGWTFVKWEGDLTGTDNPQQIIVDAPKEVTAVFAKKEYKLSVSTSGEGSVAPSPDQGTYPHGAVVELTAKADNNWEFVEWQGDLSGQEASQTITMDADKTVTATFEESSSSSSFSLADNGVTVICTDAEVGDTGVVGGITYTKRTTKQITPDNAETTCTSDITTLGGRFSDRSNFNGDLSHWDVSSVTAMNHLFKGASSFNGDLSHWDVSKVENMALMFKEATAFSGGGIGDWDVSSVTNFNSMFFGASAFNEDIGDWETGQILKEGKMGAMFFKAATFDQDLSGWCVENISEEPGGFAAGGTPLTAAHKPQWGSCP